MDAASKFNGPPGGSGSPGNSEKFFDAREYDSSGGEEDIPVGVSNITAKASHQQSDPDHDQVVKFTVGDGDENVPLSIPKTRLVGDNPAEVENVTDLFSNNAWLGAAAVNSSCDVEEYIKPRSVQDCLKLYHQEGTAQSLSDSEIISLVREKHIPAYQLEKALGDMERGVSIR